MVNLLASLAFHSSAQSVQMLQVTPLESAAILHSPCAVTTMLPPAVNVPQSSRPVTTPADEYARLTRRQRRDAREKKRIQKAARAARDELYRARQVVKDAQEVARAAREHASRYCRIPAPKNTRAISSTPRAINPKKSKSKSADSVHSDPVDMDETWSWIKESSSSASQNGSARDRH